MNNETNTEIEVINNTETGIVVVENPSQLEHPGKANLGSYPISDIVIEYDTVDVNEIKVHSTTNKAGRKIPDFIEIKDKAYQVTDRFINSIASRFGFNKGMSRLFDWPEIFDRLVVRCGDGVIKQSPSLKFGIAHTPKGPELMAVSDPMKPMFDLAKYSQVLADNGVQPESIKYQNGIVHSKHVFRKMDNIDLGPIDELVPTFSLKTPLDGYGAPKAFLSLMRIACMNGMVAQSPMFSEDIKISDRGDSDPAGQMHRFLESYNNEEGIDSLALRLESAKRSSASLQEYGLVIELLQRHLSHECQMLGRSEAEGLPKLGFYGSNVMNWLSILAGDWQQKYGITTDTKLSTKEKSQIPVACTVYDLIQVLTELSSHHLGDNDHKMKVVNGMVGTLLGSRFDLEDIDDEVGKFGNRKTYFNPEDLNELYAIRSDQEAEITAKRQSMGFNA